MNWRQHKLPGAVLEVGTVDREDGKPAAVELRIKPVIAFTEIAGLWVEAEKVLAREYGEPPPSA